MGRRVSFREIIAGCFTPGASSSSCSCFWVGSREHGDHDRKPLVLGDNNPTRTTALRLKDIISGNQTLGFHLEPKMVTMKVSMHCDGCAKLVEKHISKMDGVTSYKVDLENKRVVVVGDVIPVEIVESVSKVKFAELWDDSIRRGSSQWMMEMNSRFDPPSPIIHRDDMEKNSRKGIRGRG